MNNKITLFFSILLIATAYAQENSMNPKTIIVSEKEISIIGIQEKQNLNDKNAAANIGTLWQKFYELFDSIPHKVEPVTLYSVYSHYQQDGSYNVTIGAHVSSLKDVPKGMVSMTIPAQKYASFTVEGDFSKVIGQAWGYVWSPQFNFERTFTYDFERYDQPYALSGKANISIAVK